ncbi:hypothetical protein B0H21DRAFT_894770, partial [Amylocystis lapponica]
MCVLALAALALFESPTAVAFPALWGTAFTARRQRSYRKSVRPEAVPHPPADLLAWPPADEVLLQEAHQAARPERRSEAGEPPGGEACGIRTRAGPPPEPREVGGRLLRGASLPRRSRRRGRPSGVHYRCGPPCRRHPGPCCQCRRHTGCRHRVEDAPTARSDASFDASEARCRHSSASPTSRCRRCLAPRCGCHGKCRRRVQEARNSASRPATHGHVGNRGRLGGHRGGRNRGARERAAIICEGARQAEGSGARGGRAGPAGEACAPEEASARCDRGVAQM